jgi:ribonuclease E
MTFTEAAVDVLRREGKPLHFRKIAEIAIRENLLDHVGKIPEETMADQLAAHCRLPRHERSIVVVQHGTFALEEWGLPEDATGLELLVEPPPEAEPAYRARERHPVPSRDLARGGGREAGRRRREEGEEKRRRYPPPAEVAYEILAGAERPLPLAELAALGAERLLMPDAFVREPQSLAAALREDNRRRESAGRRPLFEIAGDAVTLAAQPEPGERPAPVPAPRAPAGPAELRRAGLAALRRRLRACDGPTVEWLVARLLEKLGLADVKVAKRGREHVVFTGRRRMGLVDIRHCVRVVRTGTEAGRRDVVEVRRDLGHYGAQIGILVTAGEASRDARGEAGAANQMPVVLYAGEALAEAFADTGLACRTIAVPEVDEAFFQQAVEVAQREEASRRARREERDRREGREGGAGEEREESPGGKGDRERERRDERRGEERDRRERGEGESAGPGAEPSGEVGPPAAGASPEAGAAVAEPPEDQEEGDEGDEGEGPDEEGEAGTAEETAAGGQGPAGGPAPEGTPGADGRRRRRRRRRRGGRGRGERRPGGEGPAKEGGAAEGGAAEGGVPPVAGEGASAAAPAGGVGPAPAASSGPAEPPPGSGGGSE